MKALNKYIKHLLNKEFKYFLQRSFSTIAPGEKLTDNWHIDLLIAYLKAIEEGKILRLIVNVPPRSLKSSIISVSWPAWLLGHMPHYKIIVASHSNSLSLKHASQSRLIMGTDWYKNAFNNTTIIKGHDNKHKFTTTQQGFRLATSVGSQITGEGADILIMDDPQTPQQAYSSKQRKHANEWFAHTFSSRLNNKKQGVILLISQRLHCHDLSDNLLKKGKLWQHLKIPARAEKNYHYQIGSFCYDYREGSLLNPSREGEAELERACLELGYDAFNAQYLQNPTNSQNSLIKANWLQRYEQLPFNTADGGYIQSWDCGVKISEQSDYSVCTTWAIHQHCYYLIEVIRKRYQYPQLKQAVLDAYDKYNCKAVLIEDKASGQALLQDLQKTYLNSISILPKENKVTRCLRACTIFAAAKVFLPNHAIWLATLEDELFNFPNAQYDDQVDSISQFLNWVDSNKMLVPRLRML